MTIQIIPVIIKKEISKNDDIPELILSSIDSQINEGDIIVVSQKIVSKQEGRIVELSSITPSLLAEGIGSSYEKDSRLVEVILSESKRIVRMENRIIIVETNNGFVCANAGVDESNVPQGFVSLLPFDSDKSAQTIKKQLLEKTGKNTVVLISDTFGRPFRMGQTDCAIGIAGMDAILDYEGKQDTFGRTLRVTAIATADELCSAAEIVMEKTKNCPVAIIRNHKFDLTEGTADSLKRPKNEDLFR